MSNPFFNERKMEQDRRNAGEAGWGAPTGMPGQAAGTAVMGDQLLGQAPVTDGPISRHEKAMTVNGTISASATLLILLLISASFGWFAASGPSGPEGQETYQFPALATIGIVVGFAAVIAAYFKPTWAKVLGPLYAVGYGFAVGAISKGYNTFYDGIVLQAAGATAAVFAAMLILYRTGVIRVTERFRKIVIGATMGVMLLYVVSFVIGLFGAEAPFINEPSLLGIGFSIFVCGLAAMNLALDFDLIERGVAQRFPKSYEWVAAMGLVVTIVWLYLELLRLLAKLQSRD
ncbi:MAG: Bax inhibitor-1/YccA family protein [Actinomycetota bacterium]